MDTLGLYLSIPFCRSKCTYCNFASGVFPASYFDRYVARLEEDLRGIRTRAAAWNTVVPNKLDSIYFGGGTPSLLPPALLHKLFAAIRAQFEVTANAEITIECAPGQLEDNTLDAMAESGVNRISFGVQSFIDDEAKHTGRLHTRAVVLRDIERVRNTGIRSINLDLIAGLPGQTRSSWRESLDVLIGAQPDHTSIYMFEIDEDSRLGREIESGGIRYYAPTVPSDDTIADMFIEAAEFLNANGFSQYEISNFASSSAQSRHNLKYWQRKPYLGLGLDAHSMLRDFEGRAVRFATTDELEPFLESPGLDKPEHLTLQQELEEAWFLGLRLNTGVSIGELCGEFGETVVSCFDTVVAELTDDGLMEYAEARIRLTAQGRLLSNEVFARFLDEPVSA